MASFAFPFWHSHFGLDLDLVLLKSFIGSETRNCEHTGDALRGILRQNVAKCEVELVEASV